MRRTQILQYPLTDLQVFRTQVEAKLGYIVAVTPRWQGYVPPKSMADVTLPPPPLPPALNAPAPNLPSSSLL